MNCRTNCCKKFSLIFALLAVAVLATSASAQTCLQNEYNLVNKQKLNCTANDVSIAQVTNIRDPLTGATLTSCINGALFNFIADFEIKTTSAQARENIGLYIADASTTQALTGSCTDNIIAPQHPCHAGSSIMCGSDNYHETDAAPDNCGDTSSSDTGAFGAGTEKVTLEIDNFLCEAPAGSNQVVLPNCTSWQIPGGTIQCVSPSPLYPYPFNGPNGTPTAIPGSPSKCNCGIIALGITVQQPSINVAKSCTTANQTNATSCTLTPEGGQVTYTVDMNNNKSNFGSVVIDQICDSAYGNVFTSGTFGGPACAVGSQCPAGSVAGSYCGTTPNTCSALSPIAFNTDETCQFTANQPESMTVLNTVTVSGHGSSNGTFGPTSSNSVSVVSNEASSSATVTKGVSSTVQACATERFTVDVANTSAAGTDETETLTALHDSAFGDITTVQGSVKATTCSTAGGVSLPVGGPDYKCTFDAQFCGAPDVNGCISNTDSVSGTITGDEAADVVSQTDNQITVTECLKRTVQ